MWARRKLAYLLDAIRLNGENAELKKAVIELARQYGLVTPYTSLYLGESSNASTQQGTNPSSPSLLSPSLPVFPRKTSRIPKIRSYRSYGSLQPNNRQAVFRALQRNARSLRRAYERALKNNPNISGRLWIQFSISPKGRPQKIRIEQENFGEAFVQHMTRIIQRWRFPPISEKEERHIQIPVFLMPSNGRLSRLKATTGKNAVHASRYLQRLKHSSHIAQSGQTRIVRGHRFVWQQGQWIDSSFRPSMRLLYIRFSSPRYFQLVQWNPTLRPFLALGSHITLVLSPHKAIRIGTQEDNWSPSKIRQFVSKSP